MEFVGNQITLKNVLATLMVAFFIGRINLFGGTFPAAIALITVMAAVSTVYIYLVPVMALGMLTYYGQNLLFYGDLAAMIFCGVFFLFFHQRRFTINQRTAVAAAVVIGFNSAYYSYENILYLLSYETLIMEVLAVIVYIRVFNTIARALFVGNGAGAAADAASMRAQPLALEEKLGMALLIAGISVIGSAGPDVLVFPLWLFMILFILTGKGILWALSAAAIGAVYWQCQFNPGVQLFIPLFMAIICGWFLAALVDGKYRKSILTFTMFLSLALVSGDQLYGIGISTALFSALPSSFLTSVWCRASAWLYPRPEDSLDRRLSSIRADLTAKRETFRGLGKLYNMEKGSRQIISYQFEGMARTVDGILADLQGETEVVASVPPAPSFPGKDFGASAAAARRASLTQVFVGSASYAGGAVSGDSSLAFTYGKNQAMIISDGMGKGTKASAESSMVVTTLSRLLSAGFDVDLAMKTVNAILLTDDSREMFASIDLAIISRETLRAQIYKMGAASTFVKHEGKVSMLKRPALPVGVTEGVKLEYLDVRLKKGDLLVMVSDGITDCDRTDTECTWLRERLMEIGSRSPDTIAELIINKAAEKYGIRERDDLTVMVAAI